MLIKDKVNKLYYKECFYSVPDNKVEDEAKQLKYDDVYTSNQLVILAAKCLVKEKVIAPFILVYDGETYHIGNDGKYVESFPLRMPYEDYLYRFLG